MAKQDNVNEEAVNEEAVSEEASGEQAVPESIGLNELAVLAQIVDLAAQRGAFRANELTQVGQVYDKLNAFLSYIKEQQEAQAEAQAEPDEVVEDNAGE